MKRKPINKYSKRTGIRTLEKAFCIIGVVGLIMIIIYCFKIDIERMQAMEAQAATTDELEITSDARLGKIVTYIISDNKTGKQYIVVYNSRGVVAITERVGLEDDE